MNDDYLWDKSGEPDPEIQELENILAPLRYQPKPLELPDELVDRRKRNYSPVLAIAATLLIALLAGGVWLRSRTEKSEQPQHQVKSIPPVVKETPTPVIVENKDLPRKPIRKHNNKSVFSKRQREEAIAAKEQVMVALRLASEKLRSAQKRTQTPSLNQIRNQHKVG
ncbi:MAG TPA: hypothetical protein VFS77_02985 [Pyrinomonadaceae bacterium]|nr:hypothetical protein [Pyrinomonadaceae bacterium]